MADVVLDLHAQNRGFERESHGDHAGQTGVAAVRNDVGQMFLKRQMQVSDASRREAMPDGQFVQRIADDRDFRSLVMERYFQAAEARRAFSPPAARRVEAHRATPDGPPSTRISLMPGWKQKHDDSYSLNAVDKQRKKQ